MRHRAWVPAKRPVGVAIGNKLPDERQAFGSRPWPTKTVPSPPALVRERGQERGTTGTKPLYSPEFQGSQWLGVIGSITVVAYHYEGGPPLLPMTVAWILRSRQNYFRGSRNTGRDISGKGEHHFWVSSLACLSLQAL